MTKSNRELTLQVQSTSVTRYCAPARPIAKSLNFPSYNSTLVMGAKCSTRLTAQPNPARFSQSRERQPQDLSQDLSDTVVPSRNPVTFYDSMVRKATS